MLELHRLGLSYGRQAKVLMMPKSTLASWGKDKESALARPPRQRDRQEEALRSWIRLLKQMKPTWGIRRVRAWIRKAVGMTIGRKRTARILREEGLLCPRLKKRQGRREKPRAEAKAPGQVFAMDQTQFCLASGRVLYLMVVLDIFTRCIVGWHLSSRCRAAEWLLALDNALMSQFPNGVRSQGLTLRLDNGCQPTSRAFQDALDILAITPEWTSYNSPKQNAHVERVIGTLKADWLWLEECETFDEAMALVTRAVDEYNNEHPHSSLEYLSPIEFQRAWDNGLAFINQNNQVEITLRAA